MITLGVADLGRARRIVVDPDGHPWETAHNPHWTVTEDGGIRLS